MYQIYGVKRTHVHTPGYTHVFFHALTRHPTHTPTWSHPELRPPNRLGMLAGSGYRTIIGRRQGPPSTLFPGRPRGRYSAEANSATCYIQAHCCPNTFEKNKRQAAHLFPPFFLVFCRSVPLHFCTLVGKRSTVDQQSTIETLSTIMSSAFYFAVSTTMIGAYILGT